MTSNDSPRVLVLQLGARLHYGAPAVYGRHGALSALYTDATASKGVLRVARRLIPERLRGATLKRLLGRVLPPEIPPERVEVDTLGTLTERISLKLRARNDALQRTDARLRRRIERDRFRGANCLYSVDNADLPLLKTARAEGLAIIYEQIITPLVGRILRHERELFPDLEPQDPAELVERGIATDTEIFQLADAVVCASQFVAEDIQGLSGGGAKVHVVPYGIEESWLEAKAQPVPGRVLFVGSVGLRKGNHYLAQATRLLRERGVPCEVHVVGPYAAAQIANPLFQGPRYHGQVPRTQVRDWFSSADVFVLPTLAESFALVHLEALAHGVPVVTTPSCGSVVRDGVEGFIVPCRSANEVAARVEQLVTDRALRARMSEGARARAKEFTWRRYGEQLMAATGAALSSRLQQ